MRATLLPWVCLCCCLLATRVSAQVEPELVSKIGTAIDKGVAWLKARQVKQGADEGSWGKGDNPAYGGGKASDDPLGPCALALFTLLSCDVDPDDPVIQHGLAFIEKSLDKTWATESDSVDESKLQASTYEAGVLLLLVEAHHDACVTRAMKAAKLDPKKDKRPALPLSKEHKAIVTSAVRWLKAMQSREGGWRYGSPIFENPNGIPQDVSATQVALLGLTSAMRLGEAVEPNMFLQAAKFNLDAQEKDGPAAKAAAPPGSEGKSIPLREGDKARGWAYCAGSPEADEKRVSGGMTASGICSLILCDAALKGRPQLSRDLAGRIDHAVSDGLAWLDLHWSVKENPGGSRSHFYYLYALERVGVLGEIDFIGSHRWYVEGARYLVDAQKGDGHWDSETEVEPADVIDSCFALLFLKKATLPVGYIRTK